MTCHNLGGAIVCTTPNTEYRQIIRCPSCRTRRRFLRTFGGWYGDRLTCCGCGRRWSDGYQMPHTRSAAKRARLIADARSRWATAAPAAGYRAACDEFLSIYCSSDETGDPR